MSAPPQHPLEKAWAALSDSAERKDHTIMQLTIERDEARAEVKRLRAVAEAAHKWRAASVSTVRQAAEYEICVALDALDRHKAD